jgi:hypothetical protein
MPQESPDRVPSRAKPPTYRSGTSELLRRLSALAVFVAAFAATSGTLTSQRASAWCGRASRPLSITAASIAPGQKQPGTPPLPSRCALLCFRGGSFRRLATGEHRSNRGSLHSYA